MPDQDARRSGRGRSCGPSGCRCTAVTAAMPCSATTGWSSSSQRANASSQVTSRQLVARRGPSAPAAGRGRGGGGRASCPSGRGSPCSTRRRGRPDRARPASPRRSCGSRGRTSPRRAGRCAGGRLVPRSGPTWPEASTSFPSRRWNEGVANRRPAGSHLQWTHAALGSLRPGRHRPARLADRPLQPALLLLHARRGSGLAAEASRCSPTTRSSGWSGSASSSSASPRCASPAASRCSGAGWPTSSRRTRGAGPAPGDLADHERARAGQDRGGAGRGRARPGQRQPRHRPPGHASSRSPAATGCTTCSPGWRRPRTPAWARSRSTPSCCAASTTTRRPSCSSWCLERGYELRFIEQMPLDAQHGWDRDAMVTADEILASLESTVTC